jgi:hypothetical protein
MHARGELQDTPASVLDVASGRLGVACNDHAPAAAQARAHGTHAHAAQTHARHSVKRLRSTAGTVDSAAVLRPRLRAGPGAASPRQAIGPSSDSRPVAIVDLEELGLAVAE